MKWTVRTMIVVALACSGAAVMWWMWPPPPPAQPARDILAGEPTLPAMKIDVVMFRPAVKRRLGLPQPVRDNPQQHVVAATRIEVDEDRPVEVSAVIDQATGRTELYERALERPLFEFRGHGVVGVFAGADQRGTPAIRIEARHGFARVLGARLGVIASADVTPSDARGFVGLGVWGEW